jgi:hypothetical protein
VTLLGSVQATAYMCVLAPQGCRLRHQLEAAPKNTNTRMVNAEIEVTLNAHVGTCNPNDRARKQSKNRI